MADLATLGIVVTYTDAANASKKLDDIAASAKRTETAIENLNKKTKRASDFIDSSASATQKATRGYADLRGEINKLNSAFGTVSASQRALKDLQLNLNKVSAATKESYQAGKLSTEGYLRLTSETDKLTRSIKNQITALNGQKNELKGLDSVLEGVGRRVKQFGQFMIAAFTLQAVMGGVKEIVSSIIDFDQSLTSLQAIAGATALEARVMGETIKSIARDTKFSAQEVAEGMQLIGKAGFTASEALKMIHDVSNLATGTLEDFDKVASLVVTAIRAFGLEVVETGRITDVFANGITKSKLSVDGLVTAFGYVGAAGAQAGLSLEEVTGSLMVLADNGIRASTMGTAFRKMLISLVGPNESLRMAVLGVGLSLDDINPALVGWEQVLKNIAPLVWDFRTNTVDMAKATEFFGLRASQVSAILIRETNQGGGLVRAIETTKELGAALRMAEKQQEGLGVKFKNISDQARNIALAIGDAGLTGTLRGLADVLKVVLVAIEDVINAFPEGAKFVGYAAGILAISGAIMGLVKAFALLKPLLVGVKAALVSPLGIFVTLAAGAATAISYFKNKVQDSSEAFELNSIKIKENISTINSWMTTLEAASNKSLDEFNRTLIRFSFENKEFSNQILQNINERRQAGDALYKSFEQLLLSAGNTKEAFRLIKEASDNIKAGEISKDIDALAGSAGIYAEQLLKLQQKYSDIMSRLHEQQRMSPSEKQKFLGLPTAEELSRYAQEVSGQIEITVRTLQDKSINVAREIYNLTVLQQQEKEWGIAFIRGLKNIIGSEGVKEAIEQFSAMWEMQMEKAGKTGVSPVVSILGDIPGDVQKMIDDIPMVDWVQFIGDKKSIEDALIVMADAWKTKNKELTAEDLATIKKLYEQRLIEAITGNKKEVDIYAAKIRELGALEEKLTLQSQLEQDKRASAALQNQAQIAKDHADYLSQVQSAMKNGGDLTAIKENYALRQRLTKQQYQELLSTIQKGEEDLLKASLDKFKQSTEKILAIKTEIRLNQEYYNDLEKGLSIKEADLILEEKRLRINLSNQGWTEAQIEDYIKLLGLIKEKTKLLNEEEAAAKKAEAEREKAIEKQIKDYEEMLQKIQDFTADTFYDIFTGNINGWEDMTNRMKNIFLKMLAEIAAQAFMANIGNRIMSGITGGPSGFAGGSMPGGGMSPMNLLSTGRSVFNLAGGGNMFTSGPVSGIGASIFGNTAWYGASGLMGLSGASVAPGVAAGWTGLTGAGGAAVAGTTTAAGSVGGMAAGLTAAMPYLAIAAIAIPMIMKALKSEKDPVVAFEFGQSADRYYTSGGWIGHWDEPGEPGPDVHTPMRPDAVQSDWGFFTYSQKMGNETNKLIKDYFEARFTALDQMLSIDLKRVVQARASAGGMMGNGWNPETHGGVEQALIAAEEWIARNLVEGVAGAFGLGSEWGEDFFRSIMPEGGQNLFDAFVRFGAVMDATVDPIEALTRQVGLLEGNTEQAFLNLETIAGVFGELNAMLDPLVTAVDPIASLNQAFEALKTTLEGSLATTEQLADAESRRNQAMGMQLTGLSVPGIQGAVQAALMGGGALDLASVFKQAIANNFSGVFAQGIFDDYIDEFNQNLAQAMQGRAADDFWEVLDETMGQSSFDGLYDRLNAFQEKWKEFFDDAEKNIQDLNKFSDPFTKFLDPIMDLLFNDLTRAFAAINAEASDLRNILGELGLDGATASIMGKAIGDIVKIRQDILAAESRMEIGARQAGLMGMGDQWTRARISTTYQGAVPGLDLSTTEGLQALIQMAGKGSATDITNWTTQAGVSVSTLFDDMDALAAIVNDTQRSFKDLISSITAFSSTALGARTSALPLPQQFGGARSGLLSTFNRAMAGDMGALEAFPGVASNFMSLSRRFEPSMRGNQANLDLVFSMSKQLEGLTQDQTEAQATFEDVIKANLKVKESIDELFSQPEARAFFSLFESVFGSNPYADLTAAMQQVRDAVNGLNLAVTVNIPGGGSVVTGDGGTPGVIDGGGTTAPPYTGGNWVDPRLASYAQQLGVSVADISGATGRANINHYMGLSAAEQAARGNPHVVGLLDQILRSQGFADGGIATGPQSGYLAKLHGTELIVPLDNRSGSSTKLSEEIRGLKEENKAMRQYLYQIVKNTQKLYDLNDKWDTEGLLVQGVA